MKRFVHPCVPSGFVTETEGSITTFAVPTTEIVSVCTGLFSNAQLELKTITATDEREDSGCFRIYYVFGVPRDNAFIVPYIELAGTESFPSLTPRIHQAALYERKIHTFFGLIPEGHPDLRPFILHEGFPAGMFPLRKDADARACSKAVRDPYAFARVEGEGVYEIPVGPVHAGIIEPGHFRFSVLGEEILLLEPRLGYKHKGIEKLFEQLPLHEKVRLSERVSGDTSFTHSLSFCQALEHLSGTQIPARAARLRVVFSELERIGNHANDIGFILQDTGYGFGGASGMRLRELILAWNDRLTGSRFLRGVNVPGGVTRDIGTADAAALAADMADFKKDFDEIIEIALRSSTVKNRLEDTGTLTREVAFDHGCVGVAGRASGLAHDARIDYPYAAYDACSFDIALEDAGDVEARFKVRIREIRTALSIIEQMLTALPQGAIALPLSALRPNRVGIGIAEGWRGEIVYFVATDARGTLSRVDVRDPSFLNWPALCMAGKGNVVPDFPLINKSFNLSYSGNDL